MLKFSWDEKKRRENWVSRKVDFAEAIGIFDEPEVIESIDGREDYGEERIRALWQTGGVFYLVAYTWRGDTRHIITAWKAGAHCNKRYQALFVQR
ncbi:MAG: BrnT family toxin [Beijerinckiaceae bacterium]|nr:BrnT family toxin [Beijerinckiaceae bacterium]